MDAARKALNLLMDERPELAIRALAAFVALLVEDASRPASQTDPTSPSARTTPRRRGRPARKASAKPHGRRRGRPPKTRPNGGTPPAGLGLTQAERDRLAFLSAAGRVGGLGHGLVEVAVDGGRLTPGDVDRVRAFLAG